MELIAERMSPALNLSASSACLRALASPSALAFASATALAFALAAASARAFSRPRPSRAPPRPWPPRSPSGAPPRLRPSPWRPRASWRLPPWPSPRRPGFRRLLGLSAAALASATFLAASAFAWAAASASWRSISLSSCSRFSASAFSALAAASAFALAAAAFSAAAAAFSAAALSAAASRRPWRLLGLALLLRFLGRLGDFRLVDLGIGAEWHLLRVGELHLRRPRRRRGGVGLRVLGLALFLLLGLPVGPALGVRHRLLGLTLALGDLGELVLGDDLDGHALLRLGQGGGRNAEQTTPSRATWVPPRSTRRAPGG